MTLVKDGGCSFCQAYVHKSVMLELKRVIEDSEIMEEDDALWPPPDRVGRQVSIVDSFIYTACAYVVNKLGV